MFTNGAPPVELALVPCLSYTMPAYTTLLSPVSLGPLRLRNRVLSTSHQTRWCTTICQPMSSSPTTPRGRRRCRSDRARGDGGRSHGHADSAHARGLSARDVAGYRQLSTAIREHETRLLVQLFHGGREQIGSSPRAPAVAPSAVPSARFKSEPRSLTVRELREWSTATRRPLGWHAKVISTGSSCRSRTDTSCRSSSRPPRITARTPKR